MHCMLMDLLHGFEVLSTTEETLFNSRNVSRLVQNNARISVIIRVFLRHSMTKISFAKFPSQNHRPSQNLIFSCSLKAKWLHDIKMLISKQPNEPQFIELLSNLLHD